VNSIRELGRAIVTSNSNRGLEPSTVDKSRAQVANRSPTPNPKSAMTLNLGEPKNHSSETPSFMRGSMQEAEEARPISGSARLCEYLSNPVSHFISRSTRSSYERLELNEPETREKVMTVRNPDGTTFNF
jgi:hypothetical protein